MTPVTWSGTETLSKTVRWKRSRKSWKTIPIVRRRWWILWPGIFKMFWPSTMICPSVGTISRKMIFRSVDLPEPLGPVMKTKSPRLTWMLMSDRAQCGFWYCFATWKSSIILGGAIITQRGTRDKKSPDRAGGAASVRSAPGRAEEFPPAKGGKGRGAVEFSRGAVYVT